MAPTAASRASCRAPRAARRSAGSTQSTISNFHSGAVTLSQTIFDFGQNLAAIRAAYAREDSLEADADDHAQAGDLRGEAVLLRSARVAPSARRRRPDGAQQPQAARAGDGPQRGRLRAAHRRDALGGAGRPIPARPALGAQQRDRRRARRCATRSASMRRSTSTSPTNSRAAAVALDESGALAAAYESRSELQSMLAQQRAAEQDVVAAPARTPSHDHGRRVLWLVEQRVPAAGQLGLRRQRERADLQRRPHQRRRSPRRARTCAGWRRTSARCASRSASRCGARCSTCSARARASTSRRAPRDQAAREPAPRRRALRNRRRQRDRADRRAGAARQRGGGPRPGALRLSDRRRRARAGDRPGDADTVNAPHANSARSRALAPRNAAIAGVAAARARRRPLGVARAAARTARPATRPSSSTAVRSKSW